MMCLRLYNGMLLSVICSMFLFRSLFAQADLITAFQTLQHCSDLPKDILFLPPSPIPENAEAVCTICKGEGRIPSVLQSKDTRFSKSTKRMHQTQLDTARDFLVPCTTCKGAKRLLRTLTLQERVERYLSVRRVYDLEHTSARHVAFGSIYIRPEALERLSPEAFATLAARFPAACSKCFGFASLPCTRCESVGFVEKYLQDTEDQAPQKHQTPCTSCDGKGRRLCKACNATGLLKSCRRCKGLGITHEKATKKRPAQTVRCRSCDGFGRR